MKSWLSAGALTLSVALGACAPATGPRVRVATATPAELAAVEHADQVWYEFQPGDIIPVQLAFFGAFEGGAEGPVAFRAKQRFFFVMSKNGPMRISFDGKTFAGPQGSQSLIAVLPRKGARGGQLGWMIYVGESGNPEAELEKLIEPVEEARAGEAAPTQ